MGRCVVVVAGIVVVLVLTLIVVGGLRVITETTPDAEPSTSVTPASSPVRDSVDVLTVIEGTPPLDGDDCCVPLMFGCCLRFETRGATILSTVVDT